ncbi:MAG: lysophospholipid acyltransferase family protein [Candidatus Omnitrophica bacterium]|nr:lysophospholipid acyltransferase family protein [Candidatus Omnitrophota bacterium]
MLIYFFYKFARFLALHLPLKAGYKIAVFISDFRYIFTPRDRINVAGNLSAIFPDKSKKEIESIQIEIFRNFAKYLVDFFRFSELDAGYIKKNIKLENLDYLDEALSKGRGAIVLSAHLGNWELGGAVLALLGYHFWGVALMHKCKKINDFFNFQRQSKGVKVIPLGNAVRQCLEVLGKNEIVALIGDRDFSEKGIVADFFNKPTFFPPGPAAFCLKTGSPIVPVFMLRNRDDTFTLKVEKPIEFPPSGDKNKDMLKLINRYKLIIENYIRAYPGQWYMFRRFWIS